MQNPGKIFSDSKPGCHLLSPEQTWQVRVMATAHTNLSSRNLHRRHTAKFHPYNSREERNSLKIQVYSGTAKDEKSPHS